MAFLAEYFTFDGISCAEFGMKIYDLQGSSQGSSEISSVGEIENDWISSKAKSYLYGRKLNKPLEFKIVFGVEPQYIKMDEYLDRFEFDVISNWLTDCDEYKWLEIHQPDLDSIRYRCIVTKLESVQHDWIPWAFAMTVTCDSPYGYIYPMRYEFECKEETDIEIFSRSTLNKPYFSHIDIYTKGSKTISLINRSYKNTEFKFDGLPERENMIISVDNENGVIKSPDNDYKNLYKYFNFKFFPLKKGRNLIHVSGDCKLVFTCEYPVNFGG